MKKKTVFVIAESKCKILTSPSLEEIRIAGKDHTPVDFTVHIEGGPTSISVSNLFIHGLRINKPVVKGGQKRVWFEAKGLRRTLTGSFCALTGKGDGILECRSPVSK